MLLHRLRCRRHSHHHHLHRRKHYYDFRQITQIAQQFITNHWILKSIAEECMDKHGNRMKKFLFPFRFFCFHRISSSYTSVYYLWFLRKVIMHLKNIACRENWNDRMERVKIVIFCWIYWNRIESGWFFFSLRNFVLGKLNEGKLNFLRKWNEFSLRDLLGCIHLHFANARRWIQRLQLLWRLLVLVTTSLSFHFLSFRVLSLEPVCSLHREHKWSHN